MKPNELLAACWSVEVVNGGAGLRRDLRVVTESTTGFRSRSAGGVLVGRLLVVDEELAALVGLQCFAIDLQELGREALAGVRLEDDLDRPVLPRGEGIDLALALDDEPNGDRLDTAGGQARRVPCATAAG